MNNEQKNTKEMVLRICFSGVFAALICVATMIIQIPSPLGGYVNLGDCFILVSAWVLGPICGFAAGGIGSAMADIITGYAYYVPGTFVIKGLVAVAAALIARAFAKKNAKLRFCGYIVSSVAGEGIMIVGYYFYAAFALGKGLIVSLDSVPGNLIQGAFGVVFGIILIQVISKTAALRKFNLEIKKH